MKSNEPVKLLPSMTPLLLVMLGAMVYLYVVLFRSAAIPRLLTGDQVYFWMNGQRMLNGEHVYRDFFQYTPPGTDLFYFAAFKAFGPRIWVTNAAVLVLGLALCWLCFSLASYLTERRMAALASFLFVVLIYGSLLNATHHWFSVLFIMLAVVCLLPGRSLARVAMAGALAGVASFFAQTHGLAALGAIAAFLIWGRFQQRAAWVTLAKEEGVLLCAFLAVVIAINAYYFATVGLTQIWYFQFTHVRRYLTPTYSIPFVTGLPQEVVVRRLALIVYAVVPGVYIFGLFRGFRNGAAGEPQTRAMLLTLVGSSLLAEVLFSLNWLRFFAVSMPAIILLAAAVGRAGKLRGYIAGFLWIATAALAADQIRTQRSQPMIVEMLPGGTALVTPQAHEKLSWIAERTNPGDFFFQAEWPGVYLPLSLRNPVFLDEISTFRRTRPEYIERAAKELENKQVRYVLWSARTDVMDRPIFHIAPLREYLRRKYRPVHTFGDGDQVWERQ